MNNTENKTKTIKTKLIVNMIGLFFIITIISSATTILTSFYMTADTLGITMRQSVESATKNFESQLNVFTMSLTEVPKHTEFNDINLNRDTIVEILSAKSQEYYCYVSFAGIDGIDITSGTNVSNETFFKKAIAGENFLDNPVLGSDGVIRYTYAVPAKNIAGNTVGVMFITPDSAYLSYLIQDSVTGENGSVYVINKDGEVVLSSDQTKISSKFNAQKTSDKAYEGIAEMELEAVKGKLGSMVYFTNHITDIGAYNPISNTDNWVFVSTTRITDFTNEVYTSLSGAIVVLVIISCIAIVLIIRLIDKFLKPMKECITRIEKLAEGDLSTPMPIINRDDEAGQLAAITGKILQELNELIKDEEYILVEASKGNFAVSSRCPEIYEKDFKPLLDAINLIISSMNTTLNKISQASDNVSSGAVQVANSSQSLAEGTITQAQSTSELSDAFINISEQIEMSTEKAAQVRDLSEQTGNEVNESNTHMAELLKAMQEISSCSNEIGKIITSIDDIAFQTNILALNAAVEAARAGEAGKGFAVVADEVRNLANKSAEQAKDSAKLLKKTFDAVENGTGRADQTATSLQGMVHGVQLAVESIREIANMMENQSSEISRLTVSVNEISGVIQTTSATSEECAATSHQLSEQAQMLRDLVSQFNLS